MTDTRESPPTALIAVTWFVVAVPLLWGVWETLVKVVALFR
ncbi:MFS transporter small subunit [Deinococcus petrolearius]|uniref:Oxalate:formate antiporter n=1 Tax=Deinococcus petrolearius TaxID=1751295 RepID=A0ABW1DHI8_9DEIO